MFLWFNFWNILNVSILNTNTSFAIIKFWGHHASTFCIIYSNGGHIGFNLHSYLLTKSKFIYLDTGCSSSTGWVPSTSSITTANGHSDDAFLVLSIRVSGFKGNKQRIGSQSVALGKISFVFELICESKCTFFFMKVSIMKMRHYI